MRLVLAASLLVLAGCSSHKNETAHSGSHHGEVVLASHDGSKAGHCSSKKAEMASMENGAKCSAKKAELASTEGAAGHCSSKKAEMASMEDGAKCAAKKVELASAAHAGHAGCNDCPKKADGSCDHEAGAKAGKECCKNHLAEATATP